MNKTETTTAKRNSGPWPVGAFFLTWTKKDDQRVGWLDKNGKTGPRVTWGLNVTGGPK
jgi:hypothetical protein